MKRTKWYPAHVKPVHVGVYEIRFHTKPQVVVYSRWDGHEWRALATNKKLAAQVNEYAWGTYPWRGLSERYKT